MHEAEYPFTLLSTLPAIAAEPFPLFWQGNQIAAESGAE